MTNSHSFSGIPQKIVNAYHLWLLQMNNEHKERLEVISTTGLTDVVGGEGRTANSILIVTYKIHS